MTESQNATPSSAINPAIDQADGLARAMNNPALYRRMLDSFSRSYSTSFQQISAALAAGDKTQAAHLAHAVKGAAATIGARILAETASNLEQSCRDTAANGMAETLSVAFNQQLAGVLAAINPGGTSLPPD